ncbi:uncharacterized protein PHALS_11432 [Plasmopara halstedii]|uniref:Uncharacterized protein n=1 Tax=Plasmopara halstedii TaxID=4781 RepID=A0A0P1A5P1_PLAHL|nr:uncharacterized protein PHALS_11432 [Plasmopara halstedii]CEG35557.1 hypothetical protein PHALS_11432 [Plasmopara halstedii]|eukprot:XP_024571926.1 hypothetical protein PHALS_11432 [Plasmopara halstedii]
MGMNRPVSSRFLTPQNSASFSPPVCFGSVKTTIDPFRIRLLLLQRVIQLNRLLDASGMMDRCSPRP